MARSADRPIPQESSLTNNLLFSPLNFEKFWLISITTALTDKSDFAISLVLAS